MKNTYREDTCPHCGHDNSTDFEYEQPDVVMSESIAQEVECTVCGTKWTQVYSISYEKTVNIRRPMNERET